MYCSRCSHRLTRSLVGLLTTPGEIEPNERVESEAMFVLNRGVSPLLALRLGVRGSQRSLLWGGKPFNWATFAYLDPSLLRKGYVNLSFAGP